MESKVMLNSRRSSRQIVLRSYNLPQENGSFFARKKYNAQFKILQEVKLGSGVVLPYSLVRRSDDKIADRLHILFNWRYIVGGETHE
jgi:hypothetical protein